MKKAVLILFLLFQWTSVVLGQNKFGLPVGVEAPDFIAFDHAGKMIHLSKVYQKGSVVLVFYRGGWCYYCNLQLQDLQTHYEEFKKLGASLLAVSVDKQDKANQTVSDKKLSFSVIGDPDLHLLKNYNVVYHVPSDLVKEYLEKYKIDLKEYSGRDDAIIAAPATFVINSQGKIVYSFASEDYNIRPLTQEILRTLEDIAPKDKGKVKKTQQIKDFILKFGPGAFWAYVILYSLNTVTLVPPILFMTLAGGAIFGPWLGSVAIMLGCLLGTTATFFISRLLGRRWIERFMRGKVKEFEEKLDQKGFLTILIVRLVAFPPWEFVNYISGLTKIKYRDYILGTTFGIIPAIIIQVYLADRAINVNLRDPKLVFQLIFAVLAFVILGFIPKIYGKIKQRQAFNSTKS